MIVAITVLDAQIILVYFLFRWRATRENVSLCMNKEIASKGIDRCAWKMSLDMDESEGLTFCNTRRGKFVFIFNASIEFIENLNDRACIYMLLLFRVNAVLYLWNFCETLCTRFFFKYRLFAISITIHCWIIGKPLSKSIINGFGIFDRIFKNNSDFKRFGLLDRPVSRIGFFMVIC